MNTHVRYKYLKLYLSTVGYLSKCSHHYGGLGLRGGVCLDHWLGVSPTDGASLTMCSLSNQLKIHSNSLCQRSGSQTASAVSLNAAGRSITSTPRGVTSVLMSDTERRPCHPALISTTINTELRQAARSPTERNRKCNNGPVKDSSHNAEFNSPICNQNVIIAC